MNNSTTAISVQVDKKDKEKVTKILKKLGVSMSGLINMTFKQVIMTEKIPFEISIPKEKYDLHEYFSKEELKKALKELEYMEKHLDKYKKYDNWEDLEKSLLSDEDEKL